MDDAVLVTIEMKLSFLEATVDELNAIVVEQRKEQALLEQRLEILTKKVEDLIEEAGDGPRPNRRPPHY
ncbi:MAG: SlyX family protein [Sphaerochaetaceae bacterium]